VIPLVVCTTRLEGSGPSPLTVMRESVHAYGALQTELQVFRTGHGNFGAAYNYAMQKAFETHDEILIANDDIVLNPSTIRVLMEDVATLRATVPRLGLVAARSDSVRYCQNIHHMRNPDPVEVEAVSPILAWISREAFEAAPFPPINWYSDDVQCADLSALGYQHFVSRAYVHHVGSSTIGHDNQRHIDEARPWIVANRPQYATRWGLITRPPLKIAVYAIAKNEAQFVERFCEAARDADAIVIADTGSTDETAELAVRCGALVHTISVRPWRFDVARNAALALVPADIDVCVSVDLDEVLEPGWREEIERLWQLGETTRMRYPFDCGQGLIFQNEKIHSRHGYRWAYLCHEYITADKRITEAWVDTDKLLMKHLPDPTKSRGQYLDMLKAARDEDTNCERSAFYYARELYYHAQHQECVDAFAHYLAMPSAKWPNNRSFAYRTRGRCYWQLGEQAKAEKEFQLASLEEPNTREPWCELSVLCYRQGRWAESFAYAMRALAITIKVITFSSDPAVWGAQPHDHAAIAAYRLGMKSVAIEQGQLALALAPDDERLKTNLKFYMED
jgi:glycosyltransferase involved in cell wall biosynthesis